MQAKQPERSPSGQPILRHQAPERDGIEHPDQDEEALEKIGVHIEQHIGRIKSVFHEILSDLVHVDVNYVAPAPGREYYTLVTSGMSDKPMTTESGAEEYRFSELMLSLPQGWPMEQEASDDERNYWPIRALKFLARFPHVYGTWLGWGHTIPNGDPPKPFAPDTKLCCALLLSPVLPPSEFGHLHVRDDKTIHFLSVVPIYREEMDLKLREGTDALRERFAAEGITELLDPHRKNVAARPKRFWLF